jgi:tetratricopeptide (TPR) repeat protein
VDGLTTVRHYHVTFGQKSKDIGSLGAALVGATASIVILTVMAGLGVVVEDSHTKLYKIAAFGVLAGYAGIRLLNPMTRKLVEQIAKETAAETAKSFGARNIETALNIKDGERVLAQYALKKDELLDKDREGAVKILENARKCFDTALQVDPSDTEALMGSANVFRELAEVKLGKDSTACWEGALRALDSIIARDPGAAQALYNRACYKSLMDRDVTEVIEDLKAAMDIYPKFGERAKADRSFAKVNQTEQFAILTGSPTTKSPTGSTTIKRVA